MDTDYIIDKLVISFMKIRFLSEKTELVGKNSNNNTNNRIDQLNNIVEKLNTTESIIDATKNKNSFGEIEKLVYSKKWNNLQHFHKMTKIKEYLNEIIKEKSVKDLLALKISELINDKKLKYVKHIVYNSTQQKITSMPILKQNDKGEFYLDSK
jgi:SOS-response transcriptional repressor LexA